MKVPMISHFVDYKRQNKGNSCFYRLYPQAFCVYEWRVQDILERKKEKCGATAILSW